MSWKDILKNDDELEFNQFMYDFFLGQIDEVEKLLEKTYEDVEETAKKLSEDTGLSLERARRLVNGLKQKVIEEIEETLAQFRKELEKYIN